MRFYTAILVLLIATVALTVQADIEVHCLHSQIVGRWTMHLSGPMRKSNLPMIDQHVLECNDQVLKPDFFTDENGARTLEIELSAPNRARVISSSPAFKGPRSRSSRKSMLSGTFTMIYDQGFEIVLPRMTLFAFSSYVKHDGRTNADGDTLITSYCNETQIGWYHDRETNTHGCFFGSKINSQPGDVVTHIPVNAVMAKVTTEEIKNKKWKNQKELVERINKGEDGQLWTAHAYDFWEDMDYDQVFSMLGGHAVVDEHVDDHVQLDRPEDILAMNEDLTLENGGDTIMAEWRPSIRRRYEEAEAIEREARKLPENWDWRNVNGIDYTSIVRNQESCGSCYVFAMLTAVESRVRIMTNNTRRVVLSPQDIVSCSHYSQKCHGGFPYLAAKYAHEYTVVPEDCMPYKGDESVPCSAKCSNPEYRVRVKEYSYIGGFFGASNEHAMMVDIYRNGPIPVNFAVYPDFMYYKSGIYSRLKGIAGRRVRGTQVNPWEPVSHSVVIVGWGVDKPTGTKYWIVQNSWGEEWGEKGFFRIRRGVDESSIESTTTSPIPELLE